MESRKKLKPLIAERALWCLDRADLIDPVRLPRLDTERMTAPWTVNELTGCWDWDGSKNARGRGHVTVESRNAYAPRFVYWAAVDQSITVFPGRAPVTVIDHVVCDRPVCVNPDHMEPTTSRLNVSRRGGTSQFVGVFHVPDRGVWRSNIVASGRPVFLGHFDHEADAARRYDAAAAVLGLRTPNSDAYPDLVELPTPSDLAEAQIRIDRAC